MNAVVRMRGEVEKQFVLMGYRCLSDRQMPSASLVSIKKAVLLKLEVCTTEYLHLSTLLFIHGVHCADV